MKLFKFHILTRHLFGALFLLFLTQFCQCAHKEASPDDLEGLFQDAEELYKDERYFMAIEKYRDIKNRFPYNSRAADAELRIADCLYQQENFIEAASQYEIFRELHPAHARSDYVQFQIAMSYFSQIPSNTARDLSAAHRAIEAFKEVMEQFGGSALAAQSKEKLEEARRKLAEHESYVADFYFNRKHYLSASYRYATLLRDYPSVGYDEESLFKLGVSYVNIRMYDNGREAFKRLITQFPGSAFRAEAESLMASGIPPQKQ